MRFLAAIPKLMPQLAKIDQKRIYIAGFSVGGESAQYPPVNSQIETDALLVRSLALP